MSTRYVTLGDGRKIKLGAYVRAWQACRSLPAKTPIGRGIDGWNQSAGEALRALRCGMDDRINRHIPSFGIGRKWDSDWQRTTRQFARAVNTARLIVRWAPKEFRARLADRLTTD